MTKQEFMTELQKKLSGLPKQDVEGRLSFYSEMIDDRREEGYSEEDAVMGIGSVDEIVVQIIEETPLLKIAKERIKPQRRLKWWEILLLVIGSPLWLSLAVAVFAVILSVYASLWSVIVSIWAVFASLVACAPSGAVAGFLGAISGSGLVGISMIGAGLVCAGLAIFLFFGCKEATKSMILLSKKIVLGIKMCFAKKEEV